jgi:hypothetical protein
MVSRSTVKPHEKSPEEASEDRQRAAASPSGNGRQASMSGATPPRLHEWANGNPQEGVL